MKNVSAPFQAYFSVTPDFNDPDMVSDSYDGIVQHCANAIARHHPLYRGYIQVRNHARLIVAEFNVLGRVS